MLTIKVKPLINLFNHKTLAAYVRFERRIVMVILVHSLQVCFAVCLKMTTNVVQCISIFALLLVPGSHASKPLSD